MRCHQHFNPRSPHGERRRGAEAGFTCKAISIHAPRTGSDPETEGEPMTRAISIHAPRTGSDCRRIADGTGRD